MSLLKTFNEQFVIFLKDVEKIFPQDADIKKVRKMLEMIAEGKPQVVVGIWKEYITDKYEQQIDEGNIEFFLKKDYTSDIDASNSSRILDGINRLRGPISCMNDANKAKCMKHIFNLTKLCKMYFESK
jgi:Lhr-like helicase